MTTFLVKVTVDIPYPISREYRETTSSPATAAARGIKQLRKDERVKGKRINQYGVKVIKLA